MKLKVSSEVRLSNQMSAQNIIGSIVAHTESLMSTGVVRCDLSWFVSENSSQKKCDPVWPGIFDESDVMKSRIASCEVQLTEQEATGVNLPLTIYNKVAQKLSIDYNWTVSVI